MNGPYGILYLNFCFKPENEKAYVIKHYHLRAGSVVMTTEHRTNAVSSAQHQRHCINDVSSNFIALFLSIVNDLS